MLLGCIADDFTGATDLANNLVRGGMRTVQTVGVPQGPLAVEADAVVVALKSRTIPAADAVAQSLAALEWLRQRGGRQFYFKYCSTFDSTPAGNIGPVTEALMDALGCDFTIACPAFPGAGRTVYQGHLFVGGVPLNESGMRDHPLTPMTDANLVRVLQAQCRRKVGLVGHEHVARGTDAIGERFARLREAGTSIAIVDVVADADLLALGRAVADLPLVTAASGVALGLPQNFACAGLLASTGDAADTLPRGQGARAVLAGSCSEATRAQVRHFIDSGGAAFALDPLALEGGAEVDRALAWAGARLGDRPVLLYTTAPPEAVKAVQQQIGTAAAAARIEQALAALARGLVERGARQLVVAGGETAGAVVQALAVRALRIGPQIDTGVPWTATVDTMPTMLTKPVLLALKSGNFGAPDFFLRAFARLD